MQVVRRGDACAARAGRAGRARGGGGGAVVWDGTGESGLVRWRLPALQVKRSVCADIIMSGSGPVSTLVSVHRASLVSFSRLKVKKERGKKNERMSSSPELFATVVAVP